jgi:hypothetical protein
MLEIRLLHARHHSHSGDFAPVLKFESDYVFEAAATRQMCACMGVGVQFCAPLCTSHAQQSRTPLAHYQGERICDAPQHPCSKFHVVVRC